MLTADVTKVSVITGLIEAQKNIKDLGQISFYKIVHKEHVDELFCQNFCISYQQNMSRTSLKILLKNNNKSQRNNHAYFHVCCF